VILGLPGIHQKVARAEAELLENATKKAKGVGANLINQRG